MSEINSEVKDGIMSIYEDGVLVWKGDANTGMHFLHEKSQYRLHRELQQLREENERLKGIIKNECSDWAETDTALRELCRPFLSEFELNGDSYGVTSIVEVVSMTIGKLKANHLTEQTAIADHWRSVVADHVIKNGYLEKEVERLTLLCDVRGNKLVNSEMSGEDSKEQIDRLSREAAEMKGTLSKDCAQEVKPILPKVVKDIPSAGTGYVKQEETGDSLLEWLWANCKIVWFLVANLEVYPVEHDARAGKSMRGAIEAVAKAELEAQAELERSKGKEGA